MKGKVEMFLLQSCIPINVNEASKLFWIKIGNI